jgi:hypothetical protein
MLPALEEYEHFDIRLIPFEGSEKIKADCESKKYRIDYPPELVFSGNFETLINTDYPIVDGYQLPVISKRFLKLLESVKPFEYDAIPVTIFDAFAKDKDNVKQTSDYVYLKIKQFILADKDNSGKEFPSEYCSDFEIFEPEEGLDPIFRVCQCPGRLFVSQAVRDAIDAYNRKNELRICGLRLYGGWKYIDYNGHDCTDYN